MRLGLYVPVLGTAAGGLGVYTREVGARLLDQHPDWVLFTEEQGSLPVWTRKAEVVRLGSNPAYRLLDRFLHRRLGRILGLQFLLRRRLLGMGIDALLVPVHEGVYRSPVPQAIVLHDMTHLRYPYSRLKAWYFRFVFRPILARADQVVTVSESTKRDLVSFWGERYSAARVVHEGFDRSLFRVHPQGKIQRVLDELRIQSPYLFYSGTHLPHKNLETVLQALLVVRERTPDLRFIVTGSPSSSRNAAFLQRAKALGLESAVSALGVLPRELLSPLMAGAVAFVFPSLNEGFGLAPLEALASGAAVLASNRASLPEVVGSGGWLLEPEDPKAWAEAILTLIERPEVGFKLRRSGLEQAARFDWDRAAAELLATMKESIPAAGAPS